jgi:4,5-dihydroxyphthalate decarboxylase
MARLQISLSCCAYDRTTAVFDGRAPIEGCDVLATPMHPEEAFHRAFKYQEFDVTELSFSSYMMTTARGECPYIGIPAFVSRLFRHSSIYVRTDRGIETPEDLKGKLIGVPEYQMTAALWVRGILEDEHGVRPSDIRWRNGGLEEPGREERADLRLPDGMELELESLPDDQTLNQWLRDGKLDGLVSARAPSCFLEGAPGVGRLFPDYPAVEAAYYEKTGLFPIMHLIGIRRSIYDKHPWIAVNVYNAFLRAKAMAYEELGQIGHLQTTLPWPIAAFDQARRVMGADYWSYGAQANAAEIAAMTRYSHDQGLSERPLSADDLFAPSTFELSKV